MRYFFSIILLFFTTFLFGQKSSSFSVDQFIELDSNQVFWIAPMSFNIHYSNSYRLSSVISTKDGKHVLALNKLSDKATSSNELFSNYSLDLMHLGARFNRFRVNLGMSVRGEIYAKMPQTTIQLLSNGNANFLDQEVEFGIASDFTSWNEFAIGLGYDFKKLSATVSFKLADGIEQFESKGSVGVYTDSALGFINLDRNIQVRSTALFDYTDVENIFFNYTAPLQNSITFENIGFLADVNLSFRDGNHFASLSVKDLGSFNWEKENLVKSYQSLGQYKFDGIDLSENLGNDLDIELIDTLTVILGIEELSIQQYQSRVTTKLNGYYQYQFSDDFLLGSDVFIAFREGFMYYKFQGIASAKLNNWLSLQASFSIDKYSFDNLGIGFNIDLPKFKVFYQAENVLGLFDPYGTKLTTINSGFYFQF